MLGNEPRRLQLVIMLVHYALNDAEFWLPGLRILSMTMTTTIHGASSARASWKVLFCSSCSAAGSSGDSSCLLRTLGPKVPVRQLMMLFIDHRQSSHRAAKRAERSF